MASKRKIPGQTHDQHWPTGLAARGKPRASFLYFSNDGASVTVANRLSCPSLPPETFLRMDCKETLSLEANPACHDRRPEHSGRGKPREGKTQERDGYGTLMQRWTRGLDNPWHFVQTVQEELPPVPCWRGAASSLGDSVWGQFSVL